MRFEPGNTLSKGRPRGARNKLASRVLADLLAVWDEPITEGSALTRGKAALRLMSRERPHEFAKLYAGIMPRELWLEQNIAGELDDGELDILIGQLRERVLAARRDEQLAPPLKVIEHAN
jgi:hypothetical protein